MAEIVYVMGLNGHRFACRGTDMAYVGGEEAARAHGLDVMERGAEEDVAAGRSRPLTVCIGTKKSWRRQGRVASVWRRCSS